MIKINFKQPKYIFPLVIFVPLCALVYFVMQTFSGGEETAGTVATDRINMELPQANAEEAGDKMYEMSRRFGDEDAFTAVSGIGEEEQKKEELEHITLPRPLLQRISTGSICAASINLNPSNIPVTVPCSGTYSPTPLLSHFMARTNSSLTSISPSAVGAFPVFNLIPIKLKNSLSKKVRRGEKIILPLLSFTG